MTRSGGSSAPTSLFNTYYYSFFHDTMTGLEAIKTVRSAATRTSEFLVWGENASYVSRRLASRGRGQPVPLRRRVATRDRREGLPEARDHWYSPLDVSALSPIPRQRRWAPVRSS